MALTINVTDAKLYTLLPNGTVKKELDNPSEFDKNRIGEFKRIELYYTASSLANLALYFDPALFFNAGTINPLIGTQPTYFWGYQIDAAATVGTYSMILNIPVPYVAALYKNYTVTLEIVNATDFIITIDYYHLYDLNSYLQNVEVNHSKLLKDRSANAVELSVSGDSVYTNGKCRPQFYLYAKDITDLTQYNLVNYIVDGYQAGFYAKNAQQASPYFDQPEWILSDSVGTVSSLSLAEDIKVRFRVASPGVSDSMHVWMIRTDTTNNTIDFRANYEASFAKIVTLGGFATINNKIKAPSVAPALVTGKYEVSFYVDKTKLTAGAKYRFIGIPYDDTNPVMTEVNSFISEEYSVGLPSYSGAYDIVGTIKDFAKEFTGNDLVCVIEERLQSILNVDYSAGVFSADILARLGLVVPNDITRYLTKIKCEIYQDIDAYTRHYFKRSVAVKSGFLGGYAIPSDLQMTNSAGVLNLKWNYRNRYESWIPNIETTYLGVPIPVPTANQNWGGRELKVRFSLELYYDDYSTPFTDNLIFIQTIRPKGYTSDVEIFKEDGETIGNAEYFCADEESCFKAKLNVASPEEYKLITTVEKAPGASGTIAENEVWTGVLTQLTSDKFASQEESFSETEADYSKFCLDNEKFVLNLDYKISAIAKRVAPPIPVDGRITEDDILREVEGSTDYRIIE